jgi:hypothetical protein
VRTHPDIGCTNATVPIIYKKYKTTVTPKIIILILKCLFLELPLFYILLKYSVPVIFEPIIS